MILQCSDAIEGQRWNFKQCGLRSDAGLPWSGKNIWKMKFFPGQGKVREFCGWPRKFRKDLESQGKVREFGKKGYDRQSSENLFCSRG